MISVDLGFGAQLTHAKFVSPFPESGSRRTLLRKRTDSGGWFLRFVSASASGKSALLL